jgi:hypothetical protein
LTAGAGAPPEVTRFLRAHPPFDALEAPDVERVAAATVRFRTLTCWDV